ncbi:hypothetical protein BJX63DRAFT_428124 [Aspergillus granulosus]|uniref:AA1-like domain-containing protein n=1 Tax=Aspergillus granulosus TaxID=176169 RepID=A0ABR4HXS1_9EURO
MRFTITALTAVAALVASTTAAVVDNPQSAPFDLNLDQSLTFDMDGDSRGGDTVYFFLTNYHANFPNNVHPCIYLGEAPRTAVSLTIPQRSVSGNVQNVPGYNIRLLSQRDQDPNTCASGVFLAENPIPFQPSAYNQ